jgi:ubiquinone biosynthesis protein UbiJ
MLTGIALNLVNHLLADERWARVRLQAFAGQITRLEVGSLSIRLAVSHAGLFVLAGPDAVASVVISLPAGAVMGAFADRSALFSTAQITGSAEFAETLAFVFRNLRWDLEDDLSKMLGDIAARRLATSGRQLLHSHLEIAKRFVINVAEYLREEVPGVASPADLAQFCTQVDGLREDCNNCERRLQLLESRGNIS